MNADQLTDLLRAIVPDWRDQPLHVVLASDAPPPDLLPPTCWGAFGPRLDLALRPWLAAAGRWSGRGPALYVADVAIRAEAAALAGDDADLADRLFRQRLLAILTHEAGHALEAAFDYSEPTDDDVEEAAEGIREFVRRPGRKPVAPWANHAAGWLHLVLHLAARLERLTGDRLPLNLVVDAGRYGLSSPWAYRQAIRDEIELFSDVAFVTLRKMGPPAAFVRLFESDATLWFAEQKH